MGPLPNFTLIEDGPPVSLIMYNTIEFFNILFMCSIHNQSYDGSKAYRSETLAHLLKERTIHSF